MKTIQYLALTALAALACSCEKELDFKYTDIDPILVIEGAQTTDGATVALTLTTPMDEPMDRTRLTNASVTIDDLSAGTSTALVPDNEGNFVSSVPGIPGHDYRLTVVRDGKTYTAEATMSQASPILGLEFQWIKMPYDYVAVLQVSFADNPAAAGDCYWVRIYRNGEPYTWTVVNDNLAVDGRIDEVLMTSRKDLDEEEDDEALRDGDIVTATVAPVSRTMHDYLEALSAGGSNGPHMFAGDFCLGYFLPAPVSTASITFRPDEMTEYK